uniref:Uncharacterized protein n=1 Tax=Cacopsylla melanoneura TaxID=428564 RepID=A0A8D8TI12_9HEMI
MLKKVSRGRQKSPNLGSKFPKWSHCTGWTHFWFLFTVWAPSNHGKSLRNCFCVVDNNVTSYCNCNHYLLLNTTILSSIAKLNTTVLSISPLAELRSRRQNIMIINIQ